MMRAPVTTAHPRSRLNQRRCNRRFVRPSAVFPMEESALTEMWLGPPGTEMAPAKRRPRFITRSAWPGIACWAPEERSNCAAIPLLSSVSAWKPKASSSEGGASTWPATNLSSHEEELRASPSRTRFGKSEPAPQRLSRSPELFVDFHLISRNQPVRLIRHTDDRH
jgi:hypothetical protein